MNPPTVEGEDSARGGLSHTDLLDGDVLFARRQHGPGMSVRAGRLSLAATTVWPGWSQLSLGRCRCDQSLRRIAEFVPLHHRSPPWRTSPRQLPTIHRVAATISQDLVREFHFRRQVPTHPEDPSRETSDREGSDRAARVAPVRDVLPTGRLSPKACDPSRPRDMRGTFPSRGGAHLHCCSYARTRCRTYAAVPRHSRHQGRRRAGAPARSQGRSPRHIRGPRGRPDTRESSHGPRSAT